MKSLMLFVLLFVVNLAFAQTKSDLFGFLKYKVGSITSDVTVSLLRYNDSASVQNPYTLDDGSDKFTRIGTYTYLLVLTFLGSSNNQKSV